MHEHRAQHFDQLLVAQIMTFERAGYRGHRFCRCLVFWRHDEEVVLAAQRVLRFAGTACLVRPTIGHDCEANRIFRFRAGSADAM